MSLVAFSRRLRIGALAALALLTAFGGVYLWRVESLHADITRLVVLQADAQDLVEGADAIASFGADPALLEAYAADAEAVRRAMRALGADFPGALAAAQSVRLLLHDARLAVAAQAGGAPVVAGAPASGRAFLRRLRLTIEDHGIAMRAALVEAVSAARARLIRTSRVFAGLLLGVSAILLGGVLAAATLVDRRIGAPLQGLRDAITAIGAGRRETAPEAARRDEMGAVIAAFNNLVRQGRLMEATLDRQAETLMMAGELARFGGWRYDAASARNEWSVEIGPLMDEPPGFSPDLDRALAYFEGADRRRAAEALEACVTRGETFDGVFHLRTARGRLIWARLVGRPTRDADGRLTGAHGAMQDVTDLEESRLREARQARIVAEAQKRESIGKLTGGVAHDFNNLLAAILANLELLREDEREPGRVEMIDGAIGAARRGAELTRNMLAFARRAPLEPQVLDLNDVVRGTMRLAARTLPSTVDIESSEEAGLWPIRADRASTESALLNLIVNANDAMPAGGRLTVETANLRVEEDYIQSRGEDIVPGRYVMLGVSDTGAGIPPETVPRIFEPFFTTKGPEGGSGLGLSMVEGFLKQTGGTVRVYSEPGVGTTFKLFFPAVQDGAAAEKDRESRPAALAPGRRILLVEDEADVLSALAMMLERAGCAVVPASSGDRALEIFQADPRFDLVVTDIVMPGRLQGPALVSALRAIRPDLPAVFMSGYAAEATVHGNGLRARDIRLMKPVQRSEFLKAVARALDSGGAGPE